MRGTLRPNPPYVQHLHGDIHFVAPREFIVDEKAERVIDEKGKPLILPTKTYEELRKKFGVTLICEPVGALDGEGAAKRIAELEGQLAEALAGQELAVKGKHGK